jgi:hypothetical protein
MVYIGGEGTDGREVSQQDGAAPFSHADELPCSATFARFAPTIRISRQITTVWIHLKI